MGLISDGIYVSHGDYIFGLYGRAWSRECHVYHGALSIRRYGLHCESSWAGMSRANVIMTGPGSPTIQRLLGEHEKFQHTSSDQELVF